MYEKRNARPDVAAPERAMTNEGQKTTGSVYADSITDSPRKQQPVEALLRKGSENMLRTSFLTAISGMTRRQLQAEIIRERRMGIPILSSCHGEGGYYLPADGEQGRKELEDCIATLTARGANTLQTAKLLCIASHGIEGQVCIDDLIQRGGE